MGLREFSMHPAQLLSVKQEILNCDLDQIGSQVKKILKTFDSAAIAEGVDRLRAL
jgi:phosphotransferase system enzyme I (PtsI)